MKSACATPPTFARNVTRRGILRSAAGAAIAGPLIVTPGKARASERLVVTSWGGTYREAMEAAIVAPFSKETGIPVRVVDNADMGKVKAQVVGKSVEWDVLDGTGPMSSSGSKEGLFEEIDRSIVDVSDLRSGVRPDGVRFHLYAGGIAWDTRRNPAGKHPVNFAQLWDTKAFPGRRSFRARINETLEAALLADSVPARDLYPLDIERGFKALDRLKPDVSKWTETTPETITIVQRNEADFSYTYANRVKAATAAGATLGFSFEQTINGSDYFQVLKGTPNREAAMKFIAFAIRPDRLAAFCERLSLIPNNRKSLPLLSAAARQWLPDMDNPNNVIVDDDWWAEHFTALQERFRLWILG